tara:strand:+ start:51 stop:656 length:606 start_codon:yes stop_codon:yes gene_type:complete
MSVANSLVSTRIDANKQSIQVIEDNLVQTNGLVETNKQDILKKTFNVIFQEQENYTNQIPVGIDQPFTILFTNITTPLVDIQNGVFSVKQNGNYLFTVNGQFQRVTSNGGISFLNYRLNSSIGQIGSTQTVELSDNSTTIPFSKSFLLPIKNAPITLWFELVRNSNSSGAGSNDGGLVTIPSTTTGWKHTPSIGVSCVYMP